MENYRKNEMCDKVTNSYFYHTLSMQMPKHFYTQTNQGQGFGPNGRVYLKMAAESLVDKHFGPFEEHWEDSLTCLVQILDSARAVAKIGSAGWRGTWKIELDQGSLLVQYGIKFKDSCRGVDSQGASTGRQTGGPTKV